MHRIIVAHGNGNLRVALSLMDDAVRYSRQAARVRTPWMRQVLVTEYRAAASDCARITRDPLWLRMGGAREAEAVMDRSLDAFHTLIVGR